MTTIYKKIDYDNIDANNSTLEKAADIIKSGGLVAFPTETVYGLGANALDPTSVKKIYIAKGRPSDNPLIVHISNLKQLDELVLNISDVAKKLMAEFWPGPLTLIFKKKPIVPDETSGGLDTVAVRFPENKIAQLFIEKCGVPIAAPSANRSGKPSPTRASHVHFDLDSKIDMILDGGSSEYGLESTILDVSTDIVCLLRPGSITKEMIEETVGTIEVDKNIFINTSPDSSHNSAPKAPGMKYTHYSPQAKVTIVNGDLDTVIEKINSLAKSAIYKDGVVKKIGILATEQTKDKYDNNMFLILVVGDRLKEETIAAGLFKMLRKFDYHNVDEVYAEGFSESYVGLAIMNRLKKASSYNIIYCNKNQDNLSFE